MNPTLLAGLLVLQAALLGLDLWDRCWSGECRDERPAVPSRTVAFLLVVTLVFSLVQFAGLSLIPTTSEMLAATRGWFDRALERAETSDELRGWSLWAVCGMAYYIAGLWDYLVHRFVSHSRWMWFTHEYHHLPRVVCTVMPGILVRPFAAFPAVLTVAATSLSMYGLLIVFGSPLWDLTPILPVAAVIATVLTASHSSFLRRHSRVHDVLKWLGLTTPQEHILHHTVEMDGNFGNFTTIWDRVFGTYLDPSRHDYRTRQIGLPYDQDFLGTLTFGRFKIPASMRERFQLARYCNFRPPSNRNLDRRHGIE